MSYQTPISLPKLHEIRVYGLNQSITTEALSEFLGKGVRVRGIILHPQAQDPFQWAQVWVASEEEVNSLLGLRAVLIDNGITISRAYSAPASLTPPYSTPNLKSKLIISPPATPFNMLTQLDNVVGRKQDIYSTLPRNLYILSLPLDLTQVEFKDLFTNYGIVEHSTLLSQLDGMGRRRGFILMSAHREAVDAMRNMHGKWIDGFKLDVSWALVQREARNMIASGSQTKLYLTKDGIVPTRRDAAPECSVIVENLDPQLFPETETVRNIFNSFGPVVRVTKLTDIPLVMIIQFEHALSATALLKANGFHLGDRPLTTRPLAIITQPSFDSSFDPFSDTPSNWIEDILKVPSLPQAPGTPLRIDDSRFDLHESSTRLKADSEPFIPSTKTQGFDEALKELNFSMRYGSSSPTAVGDATGDNTLESLKSGASDTHTTDFQSIDLIKPTGNRWPITTVWCG